jgi:hypothetical protein
MTDRKETPIPDKRRDGVAPPSGSAHSGVEAPKTGGDRKMLYLAGAAVVALLLVFVILPPLFGGADEPAGAAPVSEEAPQ